MKRFAPTAVALVLVAVTTTWGHAADKIIYNRDIRPILADNCFACHGPDNNARKADLRLDQRESAIDSGAIVPGKPDESSLVNHIFSNDAEEVMPPPASNKKLTASQKDLLKRWIAGGATYQAHWSFVPPERPPVPAVKDQAWARNPIDRFILAELDEQGLKPAPEADRRTLARRLSLDLTGLPPAPADVEAFVNDKSPDAYEKLVDKFLASPHWGEHRGRYWLDAARYADTHGIHFDNFREMWSFRDWVIGAFNRNLPFDQFTIEQLAGDLLPNHTLEQQIASGFNRCNITSNEGGLIDEEYLVLYTRDRTETTSQVWLGLTAGCAVCHDHKFDPLSQREFYEMAAFFNNTTQAAKDGNIKDTPPSVIVPSLQDRMRWDQIATELVPLKTAADERKKTARADFNKWLKDAKAEAIDASRADRDLAFHAPLEEESKENVPVAVAGQRRELKLEKPLTWEPGHVAAKSLKITADVKLEVTDAGDFDTQQAFSYGAWVKAPKVRMTGAIASRMDSGSYRGWDLWLENGRLGTHLVHQWPDNAIKVSARNPLKPGQWHHVFVTYDGKSQAGGVKLYLDGVAQDTLPDRNKLNGSIRSTQPLRVGQRKNASRLDDVVVQDLRIYSRVLPAREIQQIATTARASYLATKPADKRTKAENDELFTWWLPALDKPYQEVYAKVTKLEDEQVAMKARGTVAHVMNEKADAAMAFVLFRGEYDQRRDEVKPSTPKILPLMPADLPRNRLGFAQWLLRPEHPLTARVTVNRFWQELFGTGLVRSSGDFGATGEPPSHPELLDWLAVEFREGGWDVKKFFKLLVTSAAYRQSAVATREKLEKDAANRLLSRGPRFRMDAEMVRDYALSASGLLVPKIGGPSVKPYQPDGVWEAVAMIGSNTRDYKRDSGENLYRRSLYTFWKRAAPPATMDVFNAPSRETCTVRRERTNTPLQALVTMNDPTFVEAARHLAQRTLKDGGATNDAKFDFIARRLLSRPLGTEELTVVRASFDELSSYYHGHEADAKQLITVGESKADTSLDAPTLAAWTMMVNELMNLDEVLNK
jgi:hypothetical protein